MKNTVLVATSLLILGLFLLPGRLLATTPEIDVALVTAVDGRINRITPTGQSPVQAFVKLKQGDLLVLEGNASIQMVFFQSNRQERWSGTGRIEIATHAGNGQGLAEPQVKVLPDILVKQIARTPALDSQGRTGAVRLRSIETTDVAKLENTYKRLRAESAHDDLNPEIFLFAGLLEIREHARLEKALTDVKRSHSGNMTADVLVSLYQRALRNRRE
ncbi:MAG: hypothetical protein Q8L93_04305 [Rhodocyclaceae bacterium]|nr:hypothetical protein [Rhodocyclaceae bacterium]